MGDTRTRAEKLRAEIQANNEKIRRLEAELRANDHAIKALEREDKELERRQRTRRLIRRGAILEGFLQKPLLLSDDDVYTLLKVIFHRQDVNDVLKRVLREREENNVNRIDSGT